MSGKSIKFLRCTKRIKKPLTKKNNQCQYKNRKVHDYGKDHKCSFAILDGFIMRIEITLQKNLNDIGKEALDLVGKKNFTLKIASSNEFYDLLMHFY